MDKINKYITIAVIAILFVAGLTATYASGYNKGVAKGVAQEKATEETRKQSAEQEALKAVNPFEQTANPFEKSPVNPFENVKINPYK